uniref:Cyclin D n=1 Tax=Physcomitrium patens TaxID=3218 RepID=Q8GS62_PHYPA|nr:cyclin D [Physcomitrium patens]CAD32542.1 cyclin D protein [Physcomitrium patens]
MSPSVDCLASLYCAEDVSGTAWNESEMCGAADRVFESQPAVFMDFPVEDDEAIATLLMKEAQFMPEADYLERYQSRKLSLEARLAAIEWILKVHSFYNYSPLTVALAVNYMDRFLSRYYFPEGKEWMLQLLSVACISLAAKMEESDVPILLDFQVEQEEHIFEAHTIQRMELLVLSTLEWRMSGVTPFSYVDYFFHKLGVSDLLLRALLSRVSEIILKSIRVTTSLQYLPSVVAAASIICALEEVTTIRTGDLLRTFNELLVNVESVKDCYIDMRQSEIGPYCVRMGLKRKILHASEPQSPVGVLEAADVSSPSGTVLGFSSRESSPDVTDSPPSTNSQRKRRKLCLHNESCLHVESASL